MHTIICSMLFKKTPDQLRLLLIDTKGDEFSIYDG
ncbi:MAG: hypothetical protein GX959_01990 [Clostridiales bacterium]|nr:hypothetical protein [Clostridiales bacterium]